MDAMARLTARALTGLAFAALLGASPAARAETVAVAIADPSGISEAGQMKLLRAAESVLRDRSGLLVVEPPPRPAAGAPRRRCGEDARCVQALAAATRADFALLLSLGASESGLAVDGVWMEVKGTRAVQRKVKGVSLDAPEAPLRELVDGLLPPFARRGYGGLLVEAEPGARIKVDGRAVATAPMVDVLPVLVGKHEVDVLLPSGQARLELVSIPAGTRVPLRQEAGQELLPPVAGKAGLSGLRVASYATWSAGALVLAGSLVAAGLAQRVTNSLPPCTGGPAVCPLDPRAQQLAGTGNVLLGVGAGTMALGAGLFAFDLISTK